MRKGITSIIIFFLMLFGAPSAFAQNRVRIELEGRYWFTDLKANARVTDIQQGTDIDLKADLGVDDENFPEGRFIWYIGQSHKLRFAYLPIDYSGSKNVERAITFSGTTFNVGTAVITGAFPICTNRI